MCRRVAHRQDGIWSPESCLMRRPGRRWCRRCRGSPTRKISGRQSSLDGEDHAALVWRTSGDCGGWPRRLLLLCDLRLGTIRICSRCEREEIKRCWVEWSPGSSPWTSASHGRGRVQRRSSLSTGGVQCWSDVVCDGELEVGFIHSGRERATEYKGDCDRLGDVHKWWFKVQWNRILFPWMEPWVEEE
jgi:hypothetical protein